MYNKVRYHCAHMGHVLKELLTPMYLILMSLDRVYIYIYSGGKKNPDLPIKSTENLNMTCRHCKRLVTTPTDVVLCLYS